ncbi:unnamed protein product [Rotaria sp. Silwood1]|nr:unnamed protein product [Rotaria sp. Silwood1]
MLLGSNNQNTDLKSFPHPFRSGNYGEGSEPKTLIELQMMDYDSIRDQSMEMSVVDGVWQSDELISQDIKQSLISYVIILENVPENEQDWHPGTNKQILDLVHPSLFCFVNQITRVINDKNHFINVDNALEHIDYTRSNVYQWIPTEFNISQDGKVKIESYINNLHPIQHKNLYQIIENIFQCFIPLFNTVLTDLIYNQNIPNQIIVDPYQRYADESSSDNQDDDDDNNHHRRTIIQPDVEEFQIPLSTNSNINLCGRKLQIIVKLANIILTPSNPKYPGDDHYGVNSVYGLQDEQPLNQSLVDPTIRILSTAHIPPQQSHWYIDLMRSTSPFNRLPSLVINKIMSYIDFPMTMNQAKQHRDKLMDERKYFISQNNHLLFERPFSLCEH